MHIERYMYIDIDLYFHLYTVVSLSTYISIYLSFADVEICMLISV